MPAMVPANRIMKMPAEAAPPHSLLQIPLAARWVATKEEEHAVWVDTQGPLRPNM